MESIKLWGLDFDWGGDLRTRFASLSNPDLDYGTSDGEAALDLRGRVSLKVTGGSPFYCNSLLQWGNVELTEEDLEIADYLDLEMKEIYLGFKGPYLKLKAGIIDMNTPGGFVYDSDEWGLQIKYNFFDVVTAKAFYSAADLTEGSNDSEIPLEYMDNLFFFGLEQDSFLDLDLWTMYYHGDTQEFAFHSWWMGLER